MDILNRCFLKENNFVTRRIAGETIIVPVRAHVVDLDAIYTLDEVGTLIWECLNGRTPGPQIVEAMCLAYDVAPEEAAHDCGEFLGCLEATGLIRSSEACEGESGSEG